MKTSAKLRINYFVAKSYVITQKMYESLSQILLNEQIAISTWQNHCFDDTMYLKENVTVIRLQYILQSEHRDILYKETFN